MKQNQPILIEDGALMTATGLVHRVLEPDALGPHPTVVMLHGRYGNEEVMWIFRRTIPAHWLLIAPRAIQTDSRGGYSWHLDEKVTWPSLPTFDTAVNALTKFIQSLPQIYNSDPERIFLMGFSQGAATAFALTMQHPGLVQGIAGLVGFVPEDCETPQNLTALKELPVFMAVGKQDQFIPYDRALQCAHTLRRARATLAYYEYNTGHKLNNQGMNDLRTWWASR